MTGTSSGYCYGFLAARFNPDGTRDSTFGQDPEEPGVVSTHVGDASNDYGCGALQNDGKIVIGGGAFIYPNMFFALVRFNTDGLLDNTFGINGVVIGDPSDLYDDCTSIALQPDGKILAAGLANDNTSADFVLCRFNTNGSVDSSFGINGSMQTGFDLSLDFASSVKVQSDGRIIVAGTTQNDSILHIALVRYNENGSFDNSFGQSGKVVTDFTSRATPMVIQPDGKILIAGSGTYNGSSGIALVRYLSGLNVGINPFSEFADHVSLFPNPATTYFNIKYEFSHLQPISVVLQDLQGKILYTYLENSIQTEGIHRQLFSLSKDIPGGVYLLSIQADDGRTAIKLLKQ